MHSEATNQLLPPGSNFCWANSSALVAGKLSPQNAVARTSIWSACERLRSSDMVVRLSVRPKLRSRKYRNGYKMNTKMKALVKREARPGLWLEEVPAPRVGINDVL